MRFTQLRFGIGDAPHLKVCVAQYHRFSDSSEASLFSLARRLLRLLQRGQRGAVVKAGLETADALQQDRAMRVDGQMRSRELPSLLQHQPAFGALAQARQDSYEVRDREHARRCKVGLGRGRNRPGRHAGIVRCPRTFRGGRRAAGADVRQRDGANVGPALLHDLQIAQAGLERVGRFAQKAVLHQARVQDARPMRRGWPCTGVRVRPASG